MTAIAIHGTDAPATGEAALSPRDYRETLDARYPATVGACTAPVVLGQAGYAAFGASARQAAGDAEGYLLENAAGRRRDNARVDGWLAEARLRTQALHARVAIPAAITEDSAAGAEDEGQEEAPVQAPAAVPDRGSDPGTPLSGSEPVPADGTAVA